MWYLEGGDERCMMSYGIHIDSGGSDSLKKWMNAKLAIIKNDLVSHRVYFSHSWVMHMAQAQKWVFSFLLYPYECLCRVQRKLKWGTRGQRDSSSVLQNSSKSLAVINKGKTNVCLFRFLILKLLLSI